MKLPGCDYAQGPSPSQVKTAGKRFVCRYVSTPGNPKNLSEPEAKALELLGVAVVVVFETTANRALAGTQAGKDDALAARKQVVAAGLPVGTPIYFAVDFDPTAGQMGSVVGYLLGAATVHGHDRTGVYGGGRTLTAVANAKICKYYWQSMSTAWGPTFAKRNISQDGYGVIAGHKVDLDTAYTRDYGQHPRPKRPLWTVLYGLRVKIGSAMWRWLRAHAKQLRGG